MNDKELTGRILREYPDALIDISGEDCSFEVYIISAGFSDQTLLKRQQTVLALFADELTSGKLHALSIIAKTPEEQAKQAGAGLVQLQTR